MLQWSTCGKWWSRRFASCAASKCASSMWCNLSIVDQNLFPPTCWKCTYLPYRKKKIWKLSHKFHSFKVTVTFQITHYYTMLLHCIHLLFIVFRYYLKSVGFCNFVKWASKTDETDPVHLQFSILHSTLSLVVLHDLERPSYKQIMYQFQPWHRLYQSLIGSFWFGLVFLRCIGKFS